MILIVPKAGNDFESAEGAEYDSQGQARSAPPLVQSIKKAHEP